jgi:putative transposase
VRRLKSQVALQALCRCLGYSRQAYYKREGVTRQRQELDVELLKNVSRMRAEQPKVGGRKLYDAIEPEAYGRDRFFGFLRRNGLLVRRKRSYRRTTWAGRMRYPNLLKGCRVTRPGQVLVSDITYLETDEGFCYLFLTTDYYSRKILGWHVSRNLETSGSVKALDMAIRALPDPTGCIHHSDRGLQYGSWQIGNLIKANAMKLSMTVEDHVYENAVAERLNGILKDEYLLGERMPSYAEALKRVAQAIAIYNHKRFHNSLGRKMTPAKKFAEI